jgi:hypothetical protein
MPCPDPSTSNPKRASHPFSAHQNSPCSPCIFYLESILVFSAAGVFVYSIGPTRPFCVISGRLIMQDEKAEDCPEYPVFALFFHERWMLSRTTDAWGWGGLDWGRSIGRYGYVPLRSLNACHPSPQTLVLFLSSTPRQEDKASISQPTSRSTYLIHHISRQQNACHLSSLLCHPPHCGTCLCSCMSHSSIHSWPLPMTNMHRLSLVSSGTTSTSGMKTTSVPGTKVAGSIPRW